MNRLVLSTHEFKNEKELHEVLAKKLQLPDYYGKNLDAIWDCLTGWIELPVEFEWQHFNKSEEVLGERSKMFLNVLLQAEKELKGMFKVMIS